MLLLSTDHVGHQGFIFLRMLWRESLLGFGAVKSPPGCQDFTYDDHFVGMMMT